MDRPPGAPRTIDSPANQKGMHGCQAALRRILEKAIAQGDFTGIVQLNVKMQDSTVMSYFSHRVLPI